MQFEITAIDSTQIDSLVRIFDEFSIKNILLTNKKKIEDYSIYNPFARFNPTFVYSIAENYNKNDNQIFESFEKFITSTKSFASEYLIVSGGTRKRIDTLKFLDYMSQTDLSIPVGVAYNPYTSSGEEDTRLLKKLPYPFVKKVYLQIGEDLDKLKQGVKLIGSIREDIEITTCVLIPNRNLLSRFKFRPWRGVNLSDKYLNNFEYAQEFTKRLIEETDKLKIDKLIEVIPFTIRNVEEYIEEFR